jgi:TetR/AcrR family transcriptional repressor of nem operon
LRYPSDHKERSRARIVEQAAALLRERGIDGIGVAEIMRQAGLTHGGFYAHFDSKEALVEDALVKALDDTRDTLAQHAAALPPAQRLEAIVRFYLSRGHRDAAGSGCALAALGGEIARQHPPLRAALARQYDRLVALVAGAVADAGRPAEQASAIVSTMVGALILSRDMADPEKAQQILNSAKDAILTPPSST